MYSTSYASGIPGMMNDFHITNETVVVLGITTYLMGLAAGSLVLAPLSEMYGRRPTYLVALVLFVIFFIPCALAQNLETILISRFIGAFFAAAMVSNAPGTLGDIVSEEYRALAFSFWSLGPMNGVCLSRFARSSHADVGSLSSDHLLADLSSKTWTGAGLTGLQ
jgi:MFS family permease